MDKTSAIDLHEVPWPVCASKCLAIEYLGCGECESVCPFKFVKERKERYEHGQTNNSDESSQGSAEKTYEWAGSS